MLNIGKCFLIYILLSFANSLGPDVYSQAELIIFTLRITLGQWTANPLVDIISVIVIRERSDLIIYLKM